MDERDRLVDLALGALAEGGTHPASQRLAAYCDPGGDTPGALFSTLQPNRGTEITAADLHAMALVGAPVGAAATRRLLLGSSPERRWILHELALVPDRDLAMATGADYVAMERLLRALQAVVGAADETEPARSTYVSETLAARKFPDLFPMPDRSTAKWLGPGASSDRGAVWSAYQVMLRDQTVLRIVDAAATEVAQSLRCALGSLPSRLHLLGAALATAGPR